MLTFDSVKLRLDREQPLTFLEFNYMILQAYDFRELARHHGARLQMGGSDQWGNIVNGIELGRRTDGLELFGVTTPLLTTASGAKMGKTADGAVWLNDDALPAYDFWQYWRNTDDRDVGKFLRLFTDLPLDEIARLEALEGAEINAAKMVLANEVTTLCRGADAANTAAATARSTFEQGHVAGDLPRVTGGPDGLTIVAVLKELGFVASNNEARRKIAEGAVRVSGAVISDPAMLVRAGGGDVAIQMGAKRHGLVVAG
jgi:tyrosyl-tRNA synthetase